MHSIILRAGATKVCFSQPARQKNCCLWNGPSQCPLTKILGPSVRVCYLNIEGISRAKSEYLSTLLLDNNIDVVLIKETHAHTLEDLHKRGRIHCYDLIGATYHNAYGFSTLNEIHCVDKTGGSHHKQYL